MKALLDTSVLVAAMVETHPWHESALAWLQRVHSGEVSGCVAAHSLAETYAVLTRLPLSPPIPPELAGRLIQENLLGHFEVIPLDVEDYTRLIKHLAGHDLRGGIIYDALIAVAAD